MSAELGTEHGSLLFDEGKHLPAGQLANYAKVIFFVLVTKTLKGTNIQRESGRRSGHQSCLAPLRPGIESWATHVS